MKVSPFSADMPSQKPPMRRLTKEELSQYNGRDGAPAYIAYKSKVYDISHSFLWQKGRHQALHTAGMDLTAALDAAPHGAEMLRGFPIIGTLIAAR